MLSECLAGLWMEHFVWDCTTTSFYGEGTELELDVRGKNVRGYKGEDEQNTVDPRMRLGRRRSRIDLF